MDKKEMYRQAEQAFAKALEAAKASAKVVSKKAGEAAQLSRLFAKKLSLEHKLQKAYTEIGQRVFDKVVREHSSAVLEDTEVERLIESARRLDEQLSEIEAAIERERQKV